jgi:hypothetical protein
VGHLGPPANAQSASVGEVIALGSGRFKLHEEIVSSFAVALLYEATAIGRKLISQVAWRTYSRRQGIIGAGDAELPWAHPCTPE